MTSKPYLIVPVAAVGVALPSTAMADGSVPAAAPDAPPVSPIIDDAEDQRLSFRYTKDTLNDDKPWDADISFEDILGKKTWRWGVQRPRNGAMNLYASASNRVSDDLKLGGGFRYGPEQEGEHRNEITFNALILGSDTDVGFFGRYDESVTESPNVRTDLRTVSGGLTLKVTGPRTFFGGLTFTKSDIGSKIFLPEVETEMKSYVGAAHFVVSEMVGNNYFAVGATSVKANSNGDESQQTTGFATWIPKIHDQLSGIFTGTYSRDRDSLSLGMIHLSGFDVKVLQELDIQLALFDEDSAEWQEAHRKRQNLKASVFQWEIHRNRQLGAVQTRTHGGSLSSSFQQLGSSVDSGTLRYGISFDRTTGDINFSQARLEIGYETGDWRILGHLTQQDGDIEDIQVGITFTKRIE